jgi:hypothetical protein
MPFQNRMMTLVAFLQAQNCSNMPGSWRHPSTMLDFLTPEYYQRIARTLEDGKIQMAFFDDRLALPDLCTGPSCGRGRRGCARGEDGPRDHPDDNGDGDAAAWARSDLLHYLLRAIPRRPPLRDDGSNAHVLPGTS